MKHIKLFEDYNETDIDKESEKDAEANVSIKDLDVVSESSTEAEYLLYKIGAEDSYDPDDEEDEELVNDIDYIFENPNIIDHSQDSVIIATKNFVSINKKFNKIGLELRKSSISEATQEEEKTTSASLEELFQKLVPGSGMAETVEGELVRAIMRVWYRYYNDGDYYFRGYGKETVGPTVYYLQTQSPSSIRPALKNALLSAKKNAGKDNSSSQFGSSDGYLDGIVNAGKIIIDYVNSKNGSYEKNTIDSRDIEKPASPKYGKRTSVPGGWRRGGNF
jgi:hypothetical protein